MAKHKSKAKRKKQRKLQRNRPSDPLAEYTFKSVPHRRRLTKEKLKKNPKKPHAKVKSKYEIIKEPLDVVVPLCTCLADDKCECIAQYLATILSHHLRAYTLFTTRFPHKDRLTLASLANALTTTLWPPAVPITLYDVKVEKTRGIKNGAQCEMMVGSNAQGVRCRGHGKSKYAAKCMTLVHGMLATVTMVVDGKADECGLEPAVAKRIVDLQLPNPSVCDKGVTGTGNKPRKLGSHPMYTDTHLHNTYQHAIQSLKAFAPTLLETRTKKYVTVLSLLHHLGLAQPFETSIMYVKPKWTRVTLTLPQPDIARPIAADNKPVTVHGDGADALEARGRAMLYLAVLVVQGKVHRDTKWSQLSALERETEGFVFDYAGNDAESVASDVESEVEDMDMETDEERLGLTDRRSVGQRATAAGGNVDSAESECDSEASCGSMSDDDVGASSDGEDTMFDEQVTTNKATKRNLTHSDDDNDAEPSSSGPPFKRRRWIPSNGQSPRRLNQGDVGMEERVHSDRDSVSAAGRMQSSPPEGRFRPHPFP